MLANDTDRAVGNVAVLRSRRAVQVVMVLTLASLGLGGANAFAQAAAGPAISSLNAPFKSYIGKNPFYLPVLIDDRVRTELREVQLYVKDHPSGPWVLKERVPPTQTAFTFQAPRDGEYCFVVVTVDRLGRSSPAEVAQAAPGQIVVLDTQLPQVEVQPLPPTPAGQPVTCLVRDENLDPAKTRFFFQTGDQVWRPLDPLPSHADRFCIPVQAAFTGLVGVAACDLAGNSITREFNLGALLSPASGPTATSSQGPAVERPGPIGNGGSVSPALAERVQVVVHRQAPSGPMPANAPAPDLGPAHPSAPAVNQKAPSAPVLQTVVTPPAPLPQNIVNPPPIATDTAHLNCLVVNSTHLSLEYQIEQTGSSGVGKVEIWLTGDKGQTWQRLGEDTDRQSPIEVDLPGEGLFGLSLVASNGRGFGANPPTAGDPIDWWVEVDLTRPVAEQLNVRPISDKDLSTLLITWTARDRNLGPTPIDLYHAVSRDGPWQPIAKGLKNDGQYHWTVPPTVGAQAFVRLVVQDQAGNSFTAETSQPVLLDDQSRPRVRVTAVTTASPKAVPASGN